MELHTLILDFLLSSFNPERKDRPIPNFTRSPDIRSSNPSVFPWNVVSTCRPWLDILSERPRCWNQVAFDVARDPTPLLNAFLWSEGTDDSILIEVLVFNSAKASEEVDEATEKGRVAAITSALLPHINRCLRIVFDVMFSSSLSPPHLFFAQSAHDLSELSLECQIDDIDTEEYPDPTPNEMLHNSFSFPWLSDLSLTGFWFLRLISYVGDPSQWFAGFRLLALDLRVSTFTFRKDGHYTLRNLMQYLDKVGGLDRLQFDHLLVFHAPTSSPGPLDYYPLVLHNNVLHFSFASLSKEFLSHLNQLLPVPSPNANLLRISFKGCEIPHIGHLPTSYSLQLTDVIDDQSGTSLRNAVISWSGIALNIDSCPGFNDAFLKWITEPAGLVEAGRDPTLLQKPLAYDLESLTIVNCQSFSSTAFRNFIEARNIAAHRTTQQIEEANLRGRSISIRKVESVTVEGGPVIAESDRIWLEKNLASFQWSTSQHLNNRRRR
ncbi:hypothetical protein CVT26_002351 [Gymnopilus dilepis]|uniref:F-box domain-containing protein n=1 Tax=Gymnopilus dilepis TaxID=231916 RepID=A0A409Y3H9_9AGAR|nr:hypothetical protein CVT26_002351 [Gymnopilus dilepis]